MTSSSFLSDLSGFESQGTGELLSACMCRDTTCVWRQARDLTSNKSKGFLEALDTGIHIFTLQQKLQ